MLQQVGPVDGIHFSTQSHLPWAKLLVHVVEGVSHDVNGIDDKLHLPFLLVMRVLSYTLLVCKRETCVLAASRRQPCGFVRETGSTHSGGSLFTSSRRVLVPATRAQPGTNRLFTETPK